MRAYVSPMSLRPYSAMKQMIKDRRVWSYWKWLPDQSWATTSDSEAGARDAPSLEPRARVSARKAAREALATGPATRSAASCRRYRFHVVVIAPVIICIVRTVIESHGTSLCVKATIAAL